MHSPGVSLPGPFVTAASPALPVPPPWLRTSADRRGVRAEISGQVRSRPGRLWFTWVSSFPRAFGAGRSEGGLSGPLVGPARCDPLASCNGDAFLTCLIGQFRRLNHAGYKPRVGKLRYDR